MNWQRFVLGIFLAAGSAGVSAQVEEPVVVEKRQEREKGKLSDRIVFGGDVGLSFGTITYIKLEPIVGYRITNRLTAGLGPIYIYEKYRNYNLRTSTYGAKILSSFTVLRGEDISATGLGNVVLHAENEVINIEPFLVNGYTGEIFLGERLWIDNLLIGGGITQQLGGRFGVSLFVLWDVTQNLYSPYSNPIFKLGFMF